MPTPNTFRSSVKEKARKAVDRKFERELLTDEELDEAMESYSTDAYQAFFSDCRTDGHSTERCGAMWNRLKERGDVPTKDDTGDTVEEAQSDATDVETTTMPPEPSPEAPESETIDELEQTLQDADIVYLITTTGCPSCAQAKEVLADWIEDGLVQVENVQESNLAADIVMDLEIDALPALVMEDDGDRFTI